MITDKILEIIKSNISGSLDRIYIGMEGVSYQSSQTKSLLDLAGLSTLIRYRIYKFFTSNQDNMGELRIFTPGEIKKFASGNGNCSKDVMIGLFKTAYKEIAELPKIDDIADAYWICTYFREINKY
jgi:Holliday junction resolvasome RuvABC endonuclease subunit